MATQRPSRPITLHSDKTRRFAPGDKPPGPRIAKSLRGSLDPAGLTLLDRVLAGQFDLPDTGALEQQHLLAASWGAAVSTQPELLQGLAGCAPLAVQAFCADAVALLLALLRAHVAKPDAGDRVFFKDIEAKLAALTQPLTDAKFKPLQADIQRERHFSADLGGTLARHLIYSLRQAIHAWHRSAADAKELGSDALNSAQAVEWAFGAVAKAHQPQAAAWAEARLRERLAGKASPIAVPPELMP